MGRSIPRCCGRRRSLRRLGWRSRSTRGWLELPYYNGDLDTEEKLPEQVRELRQLIHAADGLLIATPEYNYSIPGGLKNLIDWASRPSATSSLLHKPVAIMGCGADELRDGPGSARAPAGFVCKLFDVVGSRR